MSQATELLALTTEGTDQGQPGELGMCRPPELPPFPQAQGTVEAAG